MAEGRRVAGIIAARGSGIEGEPATAPVVAHRSVRTHSPVFLEESGTPRSKNEADPDARRDRLHKTDLVAWIIPKDALSSCFSTQGIT